MGFDMGNIHDQGVWDLIPDEIRHLFLQGGNGSRFSLL